MSSLNPTNNRYQEEQQLRRQKHLSILPFRESRSKYLTLSKKEAEKRDVSASWLIFHLARFGESSDWPQDIDTPWKTKLYRKMPAKQFPIANLKSKSLVRKGRIVSLLLSHTFSAMCVFDGAV